MQGSATPTRMKTMTIANEIKNARIHLGWSQEALAERAGVSTKTVFRAEKGENLRPFALAAITEAVGLPLTTQATSRRTESTPNASPTSNSVMKEKLPGSNFDNSEQKTTIDRNPPTFTMSKRPTLFLNGASFLSPLLGLAFSLMALGITASPGLPSALSLISGLIFAMNLGMLLGCKSSLGRWLGRNHLPQVALSLSIIGIGCLESIAFFHKVAGLPGLFGASLLFSLASVILLITYFSSSYYMEDGHEQMTWTTDPRVIPSIDVSTDATWESLLRTQTIRSGDRLMRRGWFGSSRVREAEGMEWLAWRIEDVGNAEKAIVVFGKNITSARQSAAQLMNVEPDLIVVAPKASRLAELAEFTKQQRLKKQEEVDALQNQICPENFSFLMENHTTRMDRLFTQAIGTKTMLLT
jgi:transcriptional regulator with XRE-family HTH domain